jgi:VWFA-related protein
VDAQVLAQGKSVIGLKQEDFEIWDNGRLQTISSFGSEDQELDLILLLDYSSSTHEIETRVKGTAAEAMSSLDSNDRVGVVVFDTSARLVAPLNSEFQRVDAAIRAIPWDGHNTELNATLLSAVNYLRQQGRSGSHRHIIVLTDNKGAMGISNETVRDALWESDTVLSLIRFETRDRDYVNRPIHADLRQFVTATGGDLLDDSRKGTGLVEMFSRLHQRYVIMYRAPQDKPGSVHKIRVNITDKAKAALDDVRINARTGYREGQPNSDGRSKLGKSSH